MTGTPLERFHVLVAVARPCPQCPPGGLCGDCRADPDLDYSIECPGVNVAGCNAWVPCAECGDKVSDHSDDYVDQVEYDDGIIHGVEHHWYDAWCVETDRCYVQWADPDGDDIADGKPGRYPVDWEADDPGDCYLTAIQAPAVTGVAR